MRCGDPCGVRLSRADRPGTGINAAKSWLFGDKYTPGAKRSGRLNRGKKSWFSAG